ncbi:MAG: ATP-binding protein [Syntrophales bacterium]|jgi:MinD superfamily P-loop ATPase|nr:ATP-binding protein [Syntrophales bacterium]MDY0043687.1 ATP-binding protein [Syntrophales bacterium]
MKEIVIISGKGGTGKTSIIASFAALAQNKVIADCDVDAADLHLVLNPSIEHREDFSGGKKARIVEDLCIACSECIDTCRFDAISCGPGKEKGGEHIPSVNPIYCEGCGLCGRICPAEAILLEPRVNGELFISSTKYGPMVHARLGIAEGNSGKLVSLVREKAREIAFEKALDYVLVDGSPGIGCPVIASITGADLVLVVTEPTLSGKHDLSRVTQLARHFRIPAVVCINKWDLNPEIAGSIEKESALQDFTVAGRVRYDKAITEAQIKRTTVIEYTDEGASLDIKALWRAIRQSLHVSNGK